MAAKKPTKKKVVPKKKAAAKKIVAKKKPVAAKKKVAPKKKVAKKPAPKPAKKPAAPPPVEAPSAPANEPMVFAFTDEIAAFCELVNSGGAGDADLEGYESFNEQYKPSDWARNPAVDSQLLTFAMDGAGGQFSLWLQPGRALHENPVVQLGDDGELNVLASDFPSFVALVGAGVNLFTRETGELTPQARVQEFLRERWGDRTFGEPAAIISTAQAAWPGFEEWLRAQVPN